MKSKSRTKKDSREKQIKKKDIIIKIGKEHGALIFYSIIIFLSYIFSLITIKAFEGNISEILQFWTILTAFIILFIGFYKERKKEKRVKKILVNQIERLLYYIFQNSESIEHLDPFVRKEIQAKIFNLSMHREELFKIFCYLDVPHSELSIYVKEKMYKVGVLGIREINSLGREIHITEKKDKIDDIIKELKKLI